MSTMENEEANASSFIGAGVRFAFALHLDGFESVSNKE
jgi:hypothetical protein